MPKLAPSRLAHALLLATLTSTGLAACGRGESDPPSGSGSGSGDVGSISSTSAKRSVPISGGTLLVAADQERALVSDPDRDRVLLVSLTAGSVKRAIELDDGDEPGRATEDAEGRFHVVLRGSGELLTLSSSGQMLARRSVCAAPRGVDVSPKTGDVIVVCASGELAFVAPTGGVVSSRFVAYDLRDVVAQGAALFASTFRGAELIKLDPEGKELSRSKPMSATDGLNGEMVPSVAWRMTEFPSGELLLVHQYAARREIIVGEAAPPAAYGELSNPVVATGDTTFVNEQPTEQRFEQLDVLTVDADTSSDGSMIVHASPGSHTVSVTARDKSAVDILSLEEQPIAAQFRANAAGKDDVVIQTRQPSSLVIEDRNTGNERRIDLGGADVDDLGHTIFHSGPDGIATAITCASCHPEGREDGQVWNFNPIGTRRTQPLLGGVAGTKPFHWDGDLATLSSLLHEVSEKRMGNRGLTAGEEKAFVSWLDGLPALPATEKEGTEIDPGRLAFEKAGCDTCHSGERFTNDAGANVGTGGTFQVPSLTGLRYRAPFMHDGCATTVDGRFGACGGGDKHGDLAALNPGETVALKTYLLSL